jgi:hypothetical protein
VLLKVDEKDTHESARFLAGCLAVDFFYNQAGLVNRPIEQGGPMSLTEPFRRRGQARRPGRSRAAPRRPCPRPLVEALEGRLLPSNVITVTDASDSALDTGSLRHAIQLADSNEGFDVFQPVTIKFSIGSGLQTINVLYALPDVTRPVIIDGTTQPGFDPSKPKPLIVLNGAGAGAANGLTFRSGSSAVRGLVINRFQGDGIALAADRDFTIEGNYIGTDSSGTAASGNSGDGISLEANQGVTIARNVISGNGADGVHIAGSSSSSMDRVLGNFIGTDVTGTMKLGNVGSGVAVFDGANAVGGDAPADRNVISGNGVDGVLIQGPRTAGNLVKSNFIGTAVNGTDPLPNSQDGVLINGSPDNTVGGLTALKGDPAQPTPGTPPGNLISGNGGNGVHITGSDATGNLVQGNLIGLDAGGNRALPNGTGIVGDGVLIEGAPFNDIGGTAAGARNVISGNREAGIKVIGLAGPGNDIQGNYIGTNATGDAILLGGTGLRVQPDGVVISDSPGNLVGERGGEGGNVISGNTNSGIQITGPFATGNEVRGNYIGTNAAGDGRLNGPASVNTSNTVGVEIVDAHGNVIGGTTSEARNVISSNDLYGVSIFGADATGNDVRGNYIGTNAAGDAGLDNALFGVVIEHGASGNTIGGMTTLPGTAPGNVISGNGRFTGLDASGIRIEGSGTTDNLVLGNIIGLQADGQRRIANVAGIVIDGAPKNTIGGTTAAARNVIADGIQIRGAGASFNRVRGNFIGTDLTGTKTTNDLGQPFGNRAGAGVLISGAPDNTVGGTTTGAGNTVSGNLVGITIRGGDAKRNLVQGNYIGTNFNGSVSENDLGNSRDGVLITENASQNTIGGLAAGAGSVISGNGLNGVEISAGQGTPGPLFNLVQGNIIGLNAAGDAKLGNGDDGVLIDGAAKSTIGGTEATARNVISGNGGNGIQIKGSDVTENFVQGNYIGTNRDGKKAEADLGNNMDGVLITDGASNNLIGGLVAAARNVISGNGSNGVEIGSTSEGFNTVQGNIIGLDAGGGVRLANQGDGVRVSAKSNFIGGGIAAARNVISGNGKHGVEINGEPAILNFVEGNFIGTDVTGTRITDVNGQPLGNAGDGVHVEGASRNSVGGEPSMFGTPLFGNVISGNAGNGVGITGEMTGNLIRDNYIGTGLGHDSKVALPNAGHGVLIGGGAAGNRIKDNRIAFNKGAGVRVDPSSTGKGNTTADPNSISSNGGLGIDIGAEGPTPDRAPVLDPVTVSGGLATIRGTLHSTPNTPTVIELFANTEPDPSGFGEGETFIGSLTVVTDAGGDAAFTLTTSAPVPGGRFITATANDPVNGTSEFSRGVVVGGSPADVTASVTLTRGGFTGFDRRTRHVFQTVTITNTGGAPIDGPISLVLDNLAAGTLFNMTGVTSATLPMNSPYIDVLGPGVSLAVGASVTVTLEFALSSTSALPTYIPRVLAGSGQR